MPTILVTGGAGYIGSHMVKMLQASGCQTVTLDSLENGYRDAVTGGKLVVGNIGDAALLETLFQNVAFDAVMHFASYIQVGESVQYPEKYFTNNVERTKVLIAEAAKHQIPFIFSSTAAVYGNPEYAPIDEAHPLQPINPYGESKRACEALLEQAGQERGLPYGILRYFNAAGADPEGELGERHEPETHLIPIILEAIQGKREQMTIFGEDYDTEDGTCIRDYIHVWDLCDAHLKLLHALREGEKRAVFNVGTGQGYSVREVVQTAEIVTGKPVPHIIGARREGDPAVLVAEGQKLREQLGWKPMLSDLETIIQHAWLFANREAPSGE